MVFLSLGTAMSIMRPVCFFIVDQNNVRPIVKQMLVSLDRKVSEDLDVVIPDYFFPVLLTSLYCAQDCTQHIWDGTHHA